MLIIEMKLGQRLQVEKRLEDKKGMINPRNTRLGFLKTKKPQIRRISARNISAFICARFDFSLSFFFRFEYKFEQWQCSIQLFANKKKNLTLRFAL